MMPVSDPAPVPAAAPDLRWWNRLGVRLTVTIALVTVATLVILLALVLRSQERHLVASVVQSTDLLSDTIRSSTYHDMLADRVKPMILSSSSSSSSPPLVLCFIRSNARSPEGAINGRAAQFEARCVVK